MIAGSSLEVIEGTPHGFAATHAEQLNALMLDFLKSSEGTGPLASFERKKRRAAVCLTSYRVPSFDR
jgi:hypothetical protein